MNSKKKYAIIAAAIICCAAMALTETVIEPPYAVKCVIKAVLFFGVPFALMKCFDVKLFADTLSLSKKSFFRLFALGAAVYLVVMASYALTKGLFDYDELVRSLSEDQHVDSRNFIPVALYISFGNSFLEEFLFRHVSFIRLSEYSSRRTAYIFSSVMFAIYHAAMLGASFPPLLLGAALIGLAFGGFVFDFIDEKSGRLYPSWVVHMFADFALMTVWYIHI